MKSLLIGFLMVLPVLSSADCFSKFEEGRLAYANGASQKIVSSGLIDELKLKSSVFSGASEAEICNKVKELNRSLLLQSGYFKDANIYYLVAAELCSYDNAQICKGNAQNSILENQFSDKNLMHLMGEYRTRCSL